MNKSKLQIRLEKEINQNEINEGNKLITEFMGSVMYDDVNDWTQYNDKSITELWNNNNKARVHTPKGQGLPWYKVKHRGNFYQLFTDFTFSKLSKDDIKLGCIYEEHYYIINDLKFHSSWNWLIPVITKITTENIYDYRSYKSKWDRYSGNFDITYYSILSTWMEVVSFIKYINKNLK